MTGETIARRAAPARMAYWQALDSGRILLMAASAMLIIAAFAGIFALRPQVNLPAALAFGGFIAFGELFRLALPGGREAAPIAMVGAMAYAMLLALPLQGHTTPKRSLVVVHFGTLVAVKRYDAWVVVARYDALVVVAVAAIGMAVGALPHIAAGRPAGLTGMCTRLVAVSCVAFIFRPIVSAGFVKLPWGFEFAVIAFAVFVGWLVDTLVGALIRADDVGARFSVATRDEIRLQWPLGLAVGASVIIAVVGAERMGVMEIAVFVGPLLVTQLAFRRYAGIRATYLQTVRSLARVTEVAGYVEAGHSRRVSRLAVAVGRGLGLAEPELLALEYAALMHDIGQLSLREPIAGGATLLVGPDDRERIAELGADVIRQAGVLDDVADLVRYQSRPTRGHDPVPPLGSMIIKAANAFDDMVGTSTDRNRSAAALERMRLDPVEYDAGVVAVLTEVAGRRVPSRL